MSHLMFADTHGEARVSGRDMALIHEYVRGYSLGLLDDQHLEHLVAPGAWPYRPFTAEWTRAFRLYWRAPAESAFRWDDRPLDTWQVDLNTMTATGGPVLGMIAWISAQAEVHGFAEGRERQHLAVLIEQALELGMLRRDTFGYDGWNAVINLLESSRHEPIVMSYSVTDQFPVAPDGLDEDEWYEMSPEFRWLSGLDRLRHPDSNVGPLVIENISQRRYGHSLTVFDLVQRDE